MAHHGRWATITAFAVGVAMLVSPVLTATAAPSDTQASQKKTVKSVIESAKNQKLFASDAEADGKVTAFIHVSGTSGLDKAEDVLDGTPLTDASGTDARQASNEGQKAAARVRSTASRVFTQLKKLDASAQKVYVASYTVPGVAVRASVNALNELVAQNPNALSVQKIHYQVPLSLASSKQQAKTTAQVTSELNAKPANVNSDQLVGTLKQWQQTGMTGQGVNVAVVDTGLDYTHADFGGAGTTEAYRKALADTTQDPLKDPEIKNLLDPDKYKGGYDFAGTDYGSKVNGRTVSQNTPDPNPIDGEGGHHGTHVAGTSIGYGVKADGTTMKGTAQQYAHLTSADLENATIAPGSAPLAGVYALKVFGDKGGSTGLAGQALDWVAQHNLEAKQSEDPHSQAHQNGVKPSDFIKVVSMSLGGSYGDADEAEDQMVNKLTDSGVISVIAAGNDGDITDITGAPGTASSALTVAATNSGKTRQDAIRVTAPQELVNVSGGLLAGQYSSNLKGDFNVSGKVVALTDHDNLEGCKPYSDADKAAVNGNIAWISWDDNNVTCGSGQRFNMAQQAGAKGILFTSQSDIPEAGIGGNTAIPGFQLTQSASQTRGLQEALKAGTLEVTLSSALKHEKKVDYSSSLQDTVANFTSRGSHGSLDGTAKPDVAAPGVGIISASAGTGSKYELMSGTSMATPLTSGVVALVAQKHADWSPEQLKAQLINTATHDVYQQPKNGSHIVGPLRVGSGRIDSFNAVNNKVLVASTDQPSAINGQFGVVLVPQNGYTATKTFTVTNTSDQPATYNLNYLPRTSTPGVSYEVNQKQITVPKNGTATFSVTLSIPRQSDLRHTRDLTQTAEVAGKKRSYVTDATGVVQLDPVSTNHEGATSPLRVSLTSAPKPVAQTSHSVMLADNGTSGVVSVSGHGFNQGTGDEAYASKFGVFTLGGSDPAGDYFANYEGDSGERSSLYKGTRSLGGVDITRVGYASTAPQLKQKGEDPSKGMLAFAIQTAKPWSRVGNFNIIDILYQVGNQGYISEVTGDNGNPQAPADTAWVETRTYDFTTRRTGDLVDSQPIDDESVSDSNVVVARVKLSALGLTAQTKTEDADLAYFVRTYTSASNGYYTDYTDTFSGNVLKPGIWADQQAATSGVSQQSANAASDNAGQILFPDNGGTKVSFHRTSDSALPMAISLSQLLNADQSPASRDVTTVEAALAVINGLNKDDYTTGSWQGLQDTLDLVQKALNDPNFAVNVTDSDNNESSYSGQSLLDLLAQQLLIRKSNLVSVSSLKKAVDEASKLKQGDYTQGSWAPFAQALDAAKQVLANANATAEQISQALTDLQNAERNLVSLKVLNDAIAAAEKLKEDDYKPNAWHVFVPILAAVKQVQADPNATPEQIANALKTLQDAVAQLNKGKKTDFTLLDQLVSRLTSGDSTPQQGDYTADSWNAFAQAVAHAQRDLATRVTDNPVEQSEVDADISALNTALNNLVKISVLHGEATQLSKLDPNDYTADSFAELVEALSKAKHVLADPSASTDDVQKALADLTNAQKQLVSLTGLQQVLLEASSLKESDYTPATWTTLQEAIVAARGVLTDPHARAEDVKAAENAVRDAVTALQKIPAKDHGSDSHPDHPANPKPDQPDKPKPEDPLKGCPANPFMDAKTGWYASAVRYVNCKGMMMGYTDKTGAATNHFGPNDKLKRVDAVVLLWRRAGKPKATTKTHYKDQKQIPSYAVEAVAWAAEKHIMNGYGALNEFGARSYLTRQEAAKILAKAAGVAVGEPSAKDLAAYEQAKHASTTHSDLLRYMVWAYTNKVINGWDLPTGRDVDPWGVVSRAQMAKIMANSMQHGIFTEKK